MRCDACDGRPLVVRVRPGPPTQAIRSGPRLRPLAIPPLTYKQACRQAGARLKIRLSTLIYCTSNLLYEYYVILYVYTHIIKNEIQDSANHKHNDKIDNTPHIVLIP